MIKISKNKGISLIVLIITIVVIIVLATAIIVNIAKTNIIGNANESVVKQDFKTLQDELTLYIADKYAETRGKFDVSKLNADSDGVTYTGEGTVEETNIYDILKSLKNSKYDGNVTIENGKITLSSNTDEKIKEWANEALGNTANTTPSTPSSPDAPQTPDVTDTTAPTVPTTLELTATENSITAVASGSTDDVDNELAYEYSIDNTNFQESGEFTNLTEKTYTVYARAKDIAGNVSETKQATKTIKYDIVEGNNTTINGNTATTTNPVIPVGFQALETNSATWSDIDSDGNPDGWNDGLVIQDANKNEFVWVPVDGINIQYAKNFSYPSIYGASALNTGDDINALPTDISGNTITETTQITNYGGFYVGRYEAGVPANQTTIDGGSASDVDGIPVVKRGATVWTYISYDKSIPNAKSLYTNSTSVRSGLITGTQWDTICAWIESQKDSEGNSVYSMVDSKNWGNHFDDPVDGNNGRQVAGSKEEWKAKNIYDLAGNTVEWAAEKRIDDGYTSGVTFRGGCYDHNGNNHPASYRDYMHISSNTNGYISFRIALYIM